MNTTQNYPVVEPYLYFNGNCEEALQFYVKAIGAKIETVVRFKDSPEPPPPGMLPPGFENKVMHASILIQGARVMMSDGLSADAPAFKGFSLALEAKDGEQARRWFDALADGGEVTMPFGKTFFAEHFGGVTDKFGVGWMVIVPNPDYAGP